MIDLSNINVILTGATGVIGGEILDLLNKSKANVIATGTNLEKLETINTKYEKVTTKKFDISDHNSIENFVNECNEIFQGKIDILVNNAGITMDNLSIRMKDDEWNKVININLNSNVKLTKKIIRGMIKRRFGRIIFISSIIGFSGNPGQSNYASSKAALSGFSKSIALEVASRGVTSNLIAPGYIQTPMTEKLNENQQQNILDKIPVSRIGEPKDIASACVYLASDEASFITGSTLHVNGGMGMF